MPDDFKAFYNEILRAGVTENIPESIRGNFEFLSCLAFSERKELYLVRDRQEKKRILRVTKAEAREDAFAEAEILHSLDHPAIPKVIGQWSEAGRNYLLREYFEGSTLFELIKKQGVFRLDRILDIATQLCDILHYIHTQKIQIIHRDIKPENIVLTKDGAVRLIDFGIARQFSLAKSKDTHIMGTGSYMAPEQLGSEQTDGRADIYSLGVVLIFMATGETDKSDIKNQYPYKKLVPVIRKCVKKDREHRYATALRLKRRLLRIKRGTTGKVLICAGVTACIAAAFSLGLYMGQERGFQRGVDSIMDIPIFKNQPFTPEELNEPLTFDSWYLDMAVRLALNKNENDTIYRSEVTSRVAELRIYGTYILHPSLDIDLIKTHIGKGTVAYSTSDGFTIDARGDISSLEDIPNMYYLRSLTLTSQSVSDLEPLSGMKLEKICLADNFVGNLLPLKDMVTLLELDVCQNPLRDLTPISRLLSLKSLDISQTQVTDLSRLKELTKLETLSLAYCDVKDLGVLSELTNLREVDVSNTLVTDLSPLVRPDGPVTVRCAGLPETVRDRARSTVGINIVEE